MNNKPGIALDIDETLSDTITYYFSLIMNEFGNPENLSTEAMVNKYRHSSRVPYWRDDPEVSKFREGLRRSHQVFANLSPVKDSVANVQKIHQILPIKAYITARPQVLASTTKDWLKANNFPDAPVYFAPDHLDYAQTPLWKAQKLAELYPEIIALVDDNPEFIEHLPKDYLGKILMFWNKYEGDRSNIINHATWDEILQTVKGMDL